jgi:hypothetical protein
MKTLYLDVFSGMSGDMFLGALLDLGVEARALERELAKLRLDGWHLHVARGQKMGISGVKFDVHVGPAHSPEDNDAEGATQAHPLAPAPGPGHAGHGHEHSHETTFGPHGGPLVRTAGSVVELSVFESGVPPRFRLYFFKEPWKCRPPAAAGTVTLETIRPDKKRQTFKFQRRGDYLEATEELPEPHEFTAVLKLKQGRRTERRETQFVEAHPHGHTHDAPHAHSHSSAHDHTHASGPSSVGLLRTVGATHPDHGCTFAEIQRLIQTSALSDWVKRKSLAVFQRVADAEGKIHGLPPAEVHFHEVGAVDSIIDLVGACVGLELLGRPRVVAGPVVEGTGFVRCAHGRFPLPAPATLEILGARGIAVTQCEEPHELVTPTGAALLAEFAESFGPMEGLVASKVGYGLGTRDHQTRPNVLRAVLGETDTRSKVKGQRSKAGSEAETHDWETDTVAVLETNLDDISAELLGHFVERALAAGALDVFHTPVQMKKNRPGVLLAVLCGESDADRLSELMLRETTAFGVRRHVAERRKLRREFAAVRTPLGEVTVKLGRLDGQVLHAAPEYESCKKLAAQANVPLKAVYEAALRALQG